MKREELTEIIRGAAAASGYAFHTGELCRANGEIRSYPAVWLEPPVLKSSEGRTEGSLVYRATLHLMSLPTAAGQSETLAGRLEADALELARWVAKDRRVNGVAAVTCAVSSQSLTSHGEISVTLACDVSMWFYI